MESKRKLPKIPFNPKKIGFALLAVLLFFLVLDLNTRLNELTRLSAQQEKASTVIAQLESTLSNLNTQVAYAYSEGAVEEWAYGEGHMVRPGENLVIPIAPAGATPEPVKIVEATPQPVENWQIWLALLRGK
jgi:cell division protein FtsB